MKMKLYYVVKFNKGALDKEDVGYVAVPFTFDSACEYRRELDQPWKFTVAEQEVEVN